MTRSLDSVAERALQRCELSGRCSDSQSSNAHHGPSTGLLGHAANGEANVEIEGQARAVARDRALLRQADARLRPVAVLPSAIHAMGEALASLRPAWAAVGEAWGAPVGFTHVIVSFQRDGVVVSAAALRLDEVRLLAERLKSAIAECELELGRWKRGAEGAGR